LIKEDAGVLLLIDLFSCNRRQVFVDRVVEKIVEVPVDRIIEKFVEVSWRREAVRWPSGCLGCALDMFAYGIVF
jgi:hypothetical protein